MAVILRYFTEFDSLWPITSQWLKTNTLCEKNVVQRIYRFYMVILSEITEKEYVREGTSATRKRKFNLCYIAWPSQQQLSSYHLC